MNNIIEAINSKLDREVNLFNSEFETVLSRIEEMVSVRAALSIRDPLEFDFVFNQILDESGYYDLINDFIDNSYDKTYKELLEAFEEGGLNIAFSENDLQSIREIKELDIQAFRDIGVRASQNLKRDLYKYSLSNISTKDLIANIKDSLKDTDLVKYAKTYANTSIAEFNQKIIDLKAQDADGVWIYVGVEDKVTRDYCQNILDDMKYYNTSEKNKLQNDKRRKWNCRHQFLLVSKEYAEQRGYNAS